MDIYGYIQIFTDIYGYFIHLQISQPVTFLFPM